jgi:hypothetical protein
MTDIHDAAIKQAIRVLVDHANIRIDDLVYRCLNHIADPDTIAEMKSDVGELRRAVDFLKESGMVGERHNRFAEAFLKSMKEKLNG